MRCGGYRRKRAKKRWTKRFPGRLVGGGWLEKKKWIGPAILCYPARIFRPFPFFFFDAECRCGSPAPADVQVTCARREAPRSHILRPRINLRAGVALGLVGHDAPAPVQTRGFVRPDSNSQRRFEQVTLRRNTSQDFSVFLPDMRISHFRQPR